MDHHQGGMDHGGMGMPMKCSMNMLWNSQIAGTCVVFETWHIETWWGMLLSCITVIGISLGYSLLLHSMKQYDRTTAISMYFASTGTLPTAHPSPPLPGRMSLPVVGMRESNGRESPIPLLPNKDIFKVGSVRLPTQVRGMRAAMYACSVAISFWLMLVAMTYNTYLFASIIIGAFLGHIIYEDKMDVGAVLSGNTGRGLACH